VVIYGYSSDLIHLNQAWPMLEILTNETLYEADLAFKPTQQNILAFVSLIQHKFAYQLDAKQALALLWAQARIAEDQHWLSLDINYLEKLFLNLPKPFDQTDVETVVKRLTGYYSHAREFNYDQIIRGAVKVEVEGEKVGQINGLTVVETPTAEFGEPSRITANVFLGDGDIGDIERKSDLGGNIHAKAMLILSSFVSRTFAQNAPMPVSSNIVFEQSYHEVDGDSASVAELYALLSALAKLPIKQNVAVTGAMDQLGNVLVVGGLDLKIEGFYSIAKTLHPDIHHAAIIPAANAEHLNLSSEIIEAVRNGDFTIYAIEHVSDAAELLTSLPAESDEEGQDSLFEKVRSSLDKFEDDVESHPPLRLKLLQLLKLSRN
jgi:predicted ATP-dependent protease